MEFPAVKGAPAQVKQFEREVVEHGVTHKYVLTVTWGLSCGRREFSMSLETQVCNPYGRWEAISGGGLWPGCSSMPVLRAYWPQFEHAVMFSGCSSKGPLHYLDNTVYLAGTRDCFGGEPGVQRRNRAGDLLWVVDEPGVCSQVASSEQPADLVWCYEPMLVEKEMDWGPNKGLPIGAKQLDADGNHLWRMPSGTLPLVRSKEAPEPLVFAYKPLLGKGKARELDQARRSAIWYDATDEQLSVPEAELRQALQDRLPALIWQLKAIVESFGMEY